MHCPGYGLHALDILWCYEENEKCHSRKMMILFLRYIRVKASSDDPLKNRGLPGDDSPGQPRPDPCIFRNREEKGEVKIFL